MDFPSEMELLAGARAFDPTALGEIYDRLAPGLYRYAFRLLGDEAMAEDCLADTFSRFLQALRTGGGPRDHLKAYLYRVAHNWVTDWYTRRPADLELFDTLPGDERLHPENQAEGRLERQRVRKALRCLTPDQRQVVLLKYIEGWENDEIAAAVGKPVGAVKALQHRALGTLRRVLGGEEGRIDERFAEQF